MLELFQEECWCYIAFQDRYMFTAIGCILEYLTNTSVAPLQRDLVEVGGVCVCVSACVCVCVCIGVGSFHFDVDVTLTFLTFTL